jgi:pyruvate formate lyase activating enzyme
MPQIAYTMLSETLASYSVTMLGCNFRCMYCNAYRISQYPDAQWFYRGYVEPAVLADEAITRMTPDTDKISFTGGEPNLHFNKVKWCVDNGMSKQEITIVTGMKSHLIDEYLKIIKELNA